MFYSTSSGLALVALISSVSAAFTPSAKNNVAVYWGQGPDQKPLLDTCKNSAVDIVNIGFVNAFPDNSPGAYPGTNFGNAYVDSQSMMPPHFAFGEKRCTRSLTSG